MREWLVSAAGAALDRAPPAALACSDLQQRTREMLFQMGRYAETEAALAPCAALGNPYARDALGALRE